MMITTANKKHFTHWRNVGNRYNDYSNVSAPAKRAAQPVPQTQKPTVCQQMANALGGDTVGGNMGALDYADSGLATAEGLSNAHAGANSVSGTLMSMTSVADDASAFATKSWRTGTEFATSVAHYAGGAGYMVDAAQIVQGARQGGARGAGFAATDTLFNMGIGRLGLPGLAITLAYNGLGGAKGITQKAYNTMCK